MPVEQRIITLDTISSTDTQIVEGTVTSIPTGDCEVQFIKETVDCSFANQQAEIDALLADGYTLKVDEPCRKIFEKIAPPPASNVANDDYVEVAQGKSITFNVIANDTTPIAQALAIYSFTQPSHGTITKISSTSFTYTHNNSSNFSDSFTYIATNDNGNTNVATVHINIVEKLVGYIAAGFNNGTYNASVSEDLSTWGYYNIPNAYDVFKVSYLNNKWYASGRAQGASPTGQHYILESDDAVAWNTKTSPIDVPQEIFYNGSYYLMTGRTFDYYTKPVTAAISNDGINWTTTSLPLQVTTMGAIWANNMWVAFGENDDPNLGTLSYSTDGINWQSVTSNNQYFYFGYAAKYHSGTWMAGGDGEWGPRPTITTSTDGINWQTATNTKVDKVVRAIEVFNNLWVIGGRGSSQIATSTDGVSWTSRLSDPTVEIRDFLVLADRILAAGFIDENNGVIYSSTDGINWQIIKTLNIGLFTIDSLY